MTAMKSVRKVPIKDGGRPPATIDAAPHRSEMDALMAVLDRATPTALALGPTLSNAQLDHLARSWDKRNAEWREEWLDGSPQERLSRRLKTTIDRAEGFYGRLTDVQKALIRSQLESSPFDAAIQYKEVLRRQRDALQTLRALKAGASSEIQVQAEMRALLARSLLQRLQLGFAGHRQSRQCRSVGNAGSVHALQNGGKRRTVLLRVGDLPGKCRHVGSIALGLRTDFQGVVGGGHRLSVSWFAIISGATRAHRMGARSTFLSKNQANQRLRRL